MLTWTKHEVIGDRPSYRTDDGRFVARPHGSKSFVLHDNDEAVTKPTTLTECKQQAKYLAERDHAYATENALAREQAEGRALMEGYTLDEPQCPVCDPTNDCNHTDRNGAVIAEGLAAVVGPTAPAPSFDEFLDLREATGLDVEDDHEPIDLPTRDCVVRLMQTIPMPAIHRGDDQSAYDTALDLITEQGFSPCSVFAALTKGVARRVRKALRALRHPGAAVARAACC